MASTTNNDKKLLNLATTKKPIAEKKEVIKKITPEEERDLKAKAKVQELLQDIGSLTSNPSEELIEITREEQKGTEWLEEQVALLSSENKALKNELATAKYDYQKLYDSHKNGVVNQDDSAIKETVTKVFHELQANYLKMGLSNAPRQEILPAGTPNFIIAPAAFINRLIQYFPFLQHEKRF
jgi:4-hydroxy-3-methylbut-2-enyl diphosphate reductase IspH